MPRMRGDSNTTAVQGLQWTRKRQNRQPLEMIHSWPNLETIESNQSVGDKQIDQQPDGGREIAVAAGISVLDPARTA